jgi:hypothetical protein
MVTSVGLHLDMIRLSRGGGPQGCNGFHGERLIAKKPLHRFLRFTRGTDSLQPPVPVAPHSEPWRGSLSDCILIAANRCTALFVSPESPETRIGTAACASVGACSVPDPADAESIRLGADTDASVSPAGVGGGTLEPAGARHPYQGADRRSVTIRPGIPTPAQWG